MAKMTKETNIGENVEQLITLIEGDHSLSALVVSAQIEHMHTF